MCYFTVYYKGCKIDEIEMSGDNDYSIALKVLKQVYVNIELKEDE